MRAAADNGIIVYNIYDAWLITGYEMPVVPGIVSSKIVKH